MQQTYQRLAEKIEKQIDLLEEKVAGVHETFTDESRTFWETLQTRFETVQSRVKASGEEAGLKSHLGMMEARDLLENVRESAEGFLYTVSKNRAREIDIAELKAHLAKMDAQTKWEETQKELTALYGKSKSEVEKAAKKAGEEINDIMVKLSQVL